MQGKKNSEKVIKAIKALSNKYSPIHYKNEWLIFINEISNLFQEISNRILRGKSDLKPVEMLDNGDIREIGNSNNMTSGIYKWNEYKDFYLKARIEDILEYHTPNCMSRLVSGDSNKCTCIENIHE